MATGLVPISHPCGEEKGSGYNTTSCPTLEGRNQHTIVSDHVLTYAIYGILSMPRGPHCGAYYSNCAVIGHFTCQTAYVTGLTGMSYCNQTLFLREGGVWARDYPKTTIHTGLIQYVRTDVILFCCYCSTDSVPKLCL